MWLHPPTRSRPASAEQIARVDVTGVEALAERLVSVSVRTAAASSSSPTWRPASVDYRTPAGPQVGPLVIGGPITRPAHDARAVAVWRQPST